jgi:hypothetical protein
MIGVRKNAHGMNRVAKEKLGEAREVEFAWNKDVWYRRHSETQA